MGIREEGSDGEEEFLLAVYFVMGVLNLNVQVD